MSTNVTYYLAQLNIQWNEVELLISEAERVKDINQDLFNVLCRSASILIVSHLEAFTKDLCPVIVEDINNHCLFKEIPLALQKTACDKYIDDQANKHHFLKTIIEDLSRSHDFKICYKSFLFKKNNNPKPDIIKSTGVKFGINNIFENINDSIFDNAFISSNRTKKLLNQMLNILPASTKTYPYRTKKNIFSLKAKRYSGKSVWEEFLNELNKSRHAIVHGNSFENNDDEASLREKMNKIRLFQLVIIYLICSYSNK